MWEITGDLSTDLEEYLEHGGRDQAVKEPNDGIVDIPKAPDSDLHAEDDKDGNQTSEQRSKPDRDNFLPERVCELRVHNLSICKVHRKGSCGCRVCLVHSEPNNAHGYHGDEVQPGRLEPLSEGRPCIESGSVRRIGVDIA